MVQSIQKSSGMNVSKVQLSQQSTTDQIGVTSQQNQMPNESQKPTNLNNEKIQNEIKKLNDIMKATDKNLHFKFHEETNQLYVEVINSKTNEVIKSLPPEYLLELSVKMKEFVGMIIDEKI